MSGEVVDQREWCIGCGKWNYPHPENSQKCIMCGCWWQRKMRPPTHPDTPSVPLDEGEKRRARFIRQEIARGRISEDVPA